jgi:hypothetical protein
MPRLHDSSVIVSVSSLGAERNSHENGSGQGFWHDHTSPYQADSENAIGIGGLRNPLVRIAS